jgi:hypothetical protein
MIDGTKRVEFTDVELIGDTGLVLRCRIGGKIVSISPLRVLPGSDIKHAGDRGKLVLPLDVAESLGLVPPPKG